MINWDTASQTNGKVKVVVETSDGNSAVPYFIDTKKTKEKKKKIEKDKASTTTREKEKPDEVRESEKPTTRELDAKDYLSIKGFFRKNLLLEAVLEGTISNRVPNTSFKHVIIEVKFVDEEGSVIEVKNFTQHDVVQGGQSIPFKIKTRAPKKSKSVRFGIVNAKSTNWIKKYISTVRIDNEF